MAAFRLPRLPRNWRKQPGLFERYWDDVMKQIEKTLDSILSLPAIEAAIAAANAAAAAANSAAADAATAANNATDVASSTAAETALVNSYTEASGTLLTASSAGLVTVIGHTRRYGDGTSVTVAGDTFSTGGSDGDVVRVYYNDASRTGGAVTYLSTIDPAAPPVQGGNTHVVGAVVIPASGTGDGIGLKPPGYIYF